MKKLVSLVLALMLCLSCVSALAAEAWTVTCPWAPSGVAAMVNQKAASLSTTYSQDYVLVANAEKGDTATINSWLTKYTEADPQMCFIGEGMFGITAILDPERMNFTYDDFEYVENLYSSIFVASARKELGLSEEDYRAVLAKAGFREEGLLLRYLEVDKAWRDHLLMAITAEEVYGSVASAFGIGAAKAAGHSPRPMSRHKATMPPAPATA